MQNWRIDMSEEPDATKATLDSGMSLNEGGNLFLYFLAGRVLLNTFNNN